MKPSQKTNFLLVVTLVCCIIFGCEKSALNKLNISSVTVVNAVVNSNPIITDFEAISPIKTYSSTSQAINYGGFYEFARPSGKSSFVAYQASDTINPIAKIGENNDKLDIAPRNMYTLFLCGRTNPTVQNEVIFVKDDLPYHNRFDSSVSIRFINLSPGSGPVNVTLSTNTSNNEFINIAFKSITEFKNYPATASVTSYTFQFRDASTNILLGSFVMNGINNGTGANTSVNSYRFRNFTIILKGIPGGTGTAAQGTFIVNHY